MAAVTAGLRRLAGCSRTGPEPRPELSGIYRPQGLAVQPCPAATMIERFWKAPDGGNLLMDSTLDDPTYYSKPFLLNRREWIWSPERELSDTESAPEFDLGGRRRRMTD